MYVKVIDDDGVEYAQYYRPGETWEVKTRGRKIREEDVLRTCGAMEAYRLGLGDDY